MGICWERKDNEIGIDVSSSGGDSDMVAHPSVIQHKKRAYLSYNGNDMGETGFVMPSLNNKLYQCSAIQSRKITPQRHWPDVQCRCFKTRHARKLSSND